jgi:hypothetical protein
MSGGDGTDSSTRVSICQECVGACGYVLPCQAINAAAFQGPSSSGFPGTGKALGVTAGGPGTS